MRKTLKNRSAIGSMLIVVIALIGLIFVKTDYVSADKSDLQSSQSVENLYSPASGNSQSSFSALPSLIRIISALIIVVVCIYGGIYLLKRFMNKRTGHNSTTGNLEVIETIHIAPRKTVTLLRIGEKSVLVGTTENNMSLLCEQNELETEKLIEQKEPAAAAVNFGEMLSTAVAKVKEVAQKSKKPAFLS